ncbi:glutaredoxin family protein [Vandammella animalimorsus]|uniref:NrdH-redoxin n=1 Tax=Vandammella animalimorsus TaxID=2029117 RepID=A0A2A2ADA4_9BURK|nr:glutaredoxin family protein [Vandammella animalimorsus]PAT35721.1 NrdH-redoxin [Vandammella animalimorsus]
MAHLPPHATALTALAALALACAVSLPASAQEVYRSKSASGSTLYTDKPPAAGAPSLSGKGSAQAAEASNPAASSGLQAAMRRYPVSLYVMPNCPACNNGRKWLQERGIPFQEYSIKTPEDQQTAARLGIESLPQLHIGRQTLDGFSASQWAQYLDAAGYPAQSELPADYSAPAPRPLSSAAAQQPAATNASSSSGGGSAPPGFRF